MAQRRDRAGRPGRAGPVLGAFLTGNLVESLLRLGRWGEAEQLATQALNAMPEGVFAATVLLLRAELAAMTGRYSDADIDVRAARRALGQTRDEQFALTMLYSDALTALGRGDLGRGPPPGRRRTRRLRLAPVRALHLAVAVAGREDRGRRGHARPRPAGGGPGQHHRAIPRPGRRSPRPRPRRPLRRAATRRWSPRS